MAESSEQLRGVITDDAPRDFVNDLRKYEVWRQEKERDMHIAYARTVCQHIVEGANLTWVIETLLLEVPIKRVDVSMFLPFLNHLLAETKTGLQFDESLNLYQDDELKINAVDFKQLTDAFQHYVSARDEYTAQGHMAMARSMHDHLITGFPVDMLVELAKSDIVWYGMDTALVAEQLNGLLKGTGSALSFNRYLEQVTE